MPSPAALLLLPRDRALAHLREFERPPYASPYLDEPLAWGTAWAAFEPDLYDDPTDLPEPTKQEPGVHKVSVLRARHAARRALYHPDDPFRLPAWLGRDCWHRRNGSTGVGEVEVYDWDLEDEEEEPDPYDAKPFTVRYPGGRAEVIDLLPYRTLNRREGVPGAA